MKGVGRKVLLATVLGVAVFAALVLYGDLAALRRDLGAYHFGHFGAALLLASLNYLVRFVRWEIYLRVLGVRLARLESLLIFLSGFVMSITPGKVGEVWKSVLLQDRHAIPIARSAPIVVAERVTDLLSLILLASFGAYTFGVGWAPIVTGLAMVASVLIVVSSRTLTGVCLRLAAKLPLVRRVAPRLEEAAASLQELVSARRLLVPTVLAAFAWSAECLAYWEVFRGFDGVRVDAAAAFFVYSVSTIAGAVAMMPGGLGVTELGMTGLAQLLGGPTVTAAVASASTILVRLATLWFAVVIGFAAYALLLRRDRS